MQKYPKDLSQNERQIARRWTLGSIGVYASIIACMILFSALVRSPDLEVTADASGPKLSAVAAPR